MEFSEIAAFVEKCQGLGASQIRWCDQRAFQDENTPGVAPGGYINPYGYFVIGTTIGGNAIVVGSAAASVSFADHTWYGENEIEFQDHSNDGAWIAASLTGENVERSLFQLATDRESFLDRLRSGEIDQLIDAID